jgi:phosphoribosylamine-glycine ligase
MAKVLLVDTNFSSLPIYKELENLGHEVHVVGANPADCLAKSCNTYWQINYTETEALLDLINREKFTYLVPGCTDLSYSSCAVVSKGRFPGIPTVKVDEELNQKDRFRALGKRLNLPVPSVQWQDVYDKPTEEPPNTAKLRWPLVVKPVDSFSGKGVSVILHADDEELQKAVVAARFASTKGLCLIEDYIQGQLYSHSAFLSAGRVVQDFFVKEDCSANPFVVDTSHLMRNVSPILKGILRRSIEAIAYDLNLCDGLIHTQFILDGEQPWLIEITRRCPGDLYSRLIELSGGAGYVNNYVRPFLGLPVSILETVSNTPIMRHTISVPNAQYFYSLNFHEQLKIAEWIPLSLTGDHLKQSPLSRVGILFVRTENEIQLDSLYKKTLERHLYDVMN